LTDAINVTRNPGATVDTLAVRSDLTNPAGTIGYTDGAYGSHSVHIPTSASDGESGVASTQVMRSETGLTGATCDAFPASWTPVTLVGGKDTTGRQHLLSIPARLRTNVGNTYTATSANVVQIPDITAPTLVPTPAPETNVAGTQLTITMSEPLDGTATTQAGAFTIYYNGVAQPTATGISVAGSTVTLDLTSPPNDSQVATVRYSRPGNAGERMRDGHGITTFKVKVGRRPIGLSPSRPTRSHRVSSPLRSTRRRSRSCSTTPRRRGARSDRVHGHHRRHDADRHQRRDERKTLTLTISPRSRAATTLRLPTPSRR
jgi:hypothetical protein